MNIGDMPDQRPHDTDESAFVRRVRDLLAERQLTIGQLAERAELDPSLVSRLLATTSSGRREPRVEHILALARALEVTPGELVQDTEAATVLREWIPRAEFDAETAARAQAQSEASALRTDLAGARAEVDGLRTSVRELTEAARKVREQAIKAEDHARNNALARDVANARAAQAISERDQALAQRDQFHRAWTDLYSRAMQLQRDLSGAKSRASAGWLAALFAGGFALAASTSDPPPPARKRRKPR